MTEIRSMTAYGSFEDPGMRVEVRTLNSRFLDVHVRLPRLLSTLEPEVRAAVARKMSRGRVEVNVHLSESELKREFLTLDGELAATYHRLLEEMKLSLGLPGEVGLAELLSFKEIFRLPEGEEVLKNAGAALKEGLAQALARADEMRKREGAALASDLYSRLESLKSIQGRISREAPRMVMDNFERLKEKMGELLGDAGVPEERVLQEAALFAERADITEELVRLESHLDAGLEALGAGGEVGKRLNFLLQEMGREVNTLGSKCQDAHIAKDVVEMKLELEKMREQVQNLE